MAKSDSVVFLRMSAAMKAEIVAAAGWRSVSGWLRDVANSALEKGRAEVRKNEEPIEVAVSVREKKTSVAKSPARAVRVVARAKRVVPGSRSRLGRQ